MKGNPDIVRKTRGGTPARYHVKPLFKVLVFQAVAEGAKRIIQDKALKSSSAFFSQLQNEKEKEAAEAAKDGGKKKKRVNQRTTKPAASFKL